VCNECLSLALRQLHAHASRRESVGRFSREDRARAREEKSESCRVATRRVHVAATRCLPHNSSTGVWTEFISARLRRLPRRDTRPACRAC